MLAARPALLHPSALSPAEHEAWLPVVKQFVDDAVSQTQLRLADPAAVWEWVVRLFGPVSNATGFETLAIIRSPSASTSSSVDPVHLLLSILRLYSHSKSNRHITRDHVFIQLYEPILYSPSPPVATTENSKVKSQGFPIDVSLAENRQESRRESREDLSPSRQNSLKSSLSSNNPFLRHTPSKIVKEASSQTRNDSLDRDGLNLSPPLPPRPVVSETETQGNTVDGKAEHITSSSTLPPPLPSRRVTSAPDSSYLPGRKTFVQIPLSSAGPHLSIISSSSPVPSLTLADSSILKPLPRTKVGVNSSHIGPMARLRTEANYSQGKSTTSDLLEGTDSQLMSIAIQKGKMSRSNSNLSTLSGPLNNRPLSFDKDEPFTPEQWHTSSQLYSGTASKQKDARLEPTSFTLASKVSPDAAVSRNRAHPVLSRSQTVGSKTIPPPPPKRRSDVSPVIGHYRNPFKDQETTSEGKIPLRSSKSLSSSVGRGGRLEYNRQHERNVSLSSQASEKLKEIGSDLSTMIIKSGQTSEVWVHKAKGSLSGRGSSNREEQERLYRAKGSRDDDANDVDDYDDDRETGDCDKEYEAEVRIRKEELEREGRRANETGWAQL